MKRIAALLLGVSVLFAGCGRTAPASTAPADTTVGSSATTTTTTTTATTATTAPAPSEEDTPVTDAVTNIALFGVDSRSGDFTGNTDSIMILSVDAAHRSVKLVSVMRDTLVYLDGYGYAKINAAYAKGGPTLALETLNAAFALDIRDYAIVNFEGMADIIDVLGGVTLTVTEEERGAANSLLGAEDDIAAAGQQRLSGRQAVAWSRIRSVATAEGVRNDFGRTDRQRTLMREMLRRAKECGLTQLPSLLGTALPYVETSLSMNELLAMASVALDADLAETRVPLTSYVIDADYRDATGSSAVYYDLDYAARLLHAFLYDGIPPTDYIAQHGVEKNEWAR